MTPLAERTNDAPGEKAGTPTVSRCLADGTLIELLYDSEARTTAFAVTGAGRWTVEHEVMVAGECDRGSLRTCFLRTPEASRMTSWRLLP
jgi:hypothetical protein